MVSNLQGRSSGCAAPIQIQTPLEQRHKSLPPTTQTRSHFLKEERRQQPGSRTSKRFFSASPPAERLRNGPSSRSRRGRPGHCTSGRPGARAAYTRPRPRAPSAAHSGGPAIRTPAAKQGGVPPFPRPAPLMPSWGEWTSAGRKESVLKHWAEHPPTWQKEAVVAGQLSDRQWPCPAADPEWSRFEWIRGTC